MNKLTLTILLTLSTSAFASDNKDTEVADCTKCLEADMNLVIMDAMDKKDTRLNAAIASFHQEMKERTGK